MMATASNILFIFVPKHNANKQTHADKKLLPKQAAIDYIIQHNPKVVVVDWTVQERALADIRRSVRPWFSGKIIKSSR